MSEENFCPCCGADETDWNGPRADFQYTERDQELALRARVAEVEAHNKRMWDFICSLDGMNAGHMHDGVIDDEIAIVASDFNALAAAERSQKPEQDQQG